MRGVTTKLARAMALIIGAAVPTTLVSTTLFASAVLLVSTALLDPAVLFNPAAMAQQALKAPGGPSQPDCQTVRTCNFSRNGAVRGCLSSYTCRTCRVVRARCAIGANRANCREFVCTWGG